jgi:hypothetical protein
VEFKLLSKASRPFDGTVLPSIVRGGTFKDYKKKGIVFAQGAPADEVSHIEKAESS